MIEDESAGLLMVCIEVKPRALRRLVSVVTLLALALLALLLSVSKGWAFYGGHTFEDRRQAYIEDQGRRWEGDFPDAMRQAIFAWLEAERLGLSDSSWNGKPRKQLISEEIGYLTSDECHAVQEPTESPRLSLPDIPSNGL